MLLIMIVVFVTTYMLILPAITMEHSPICGKEEHIHTALCLDNGIMLLNNESLDINDLTYKLVMNPNTSYTLVITGNGSRIPANVTDSIDFSKYRNLITKIDIQVTASSNLTIGEKAFRNCTALKEVA